MQPVDPVPTNGARLPAATRLGRVRLQVADLDRSLRYYESVLGFRTIERGHGEATLGAHGDDAPLVVLCERAGAAPAHRRGRLGLFHFAVLLPDRAALGRFLTHLAAVGVRAGSSDHLVSEAIYLQDPDGLGIEVYADRPRDTWRRRNGELVMATEPLDAQDLVRAAAGRPWTGMPPGTTLGHVHLHVGDLSEAAAFYEAALGLDVVVRGYPGALFLSAGGYHHHLGVNTWAGPGAGPPGPDDAQLLDWTIRVPDAGAAEAAARRLAAAARPTTPSARGFLATDPWGTVLRVEADDA